jgi:hypothetical protein
MKAYEALSKCLGIRLTAETLEQYIKELSQHAGNADLLLYEAYVLVKDWQAHTTKDEISRLAFLRKCEDLGICDGDEQTDKTNEQKD